jgi:hypothetical protein
LPAYFAKFANNFSVALNVLTEFLLPEFDTGFWHVGIFTVLMSVPEAAMNEDGDLESWENKVWFARERPIQGTIHSESKTFAMEQGTHGLLRAGVS